ncbi:MAG: hypothetical protein AB8H80_21200 [Planctomycetota bacterium]
MPAESNLHSSSAPGRADRFRRAIMIATAAMASLALAHHTPAQTFVVDAAGGPGVQFVDMPAAVAAAPDGATLRVRAGFYHAFEIDQKSLVVLAESGAIAIGISGRIGVVNLTAQQEVTIRGFEHRTVVGFPQLVIENNAGRVLIESCGVQLGAIGAIRVADSADVRMRDCVYAQSSSFAHVVARSRVRISRCLLANRSFAPALDVADSFVEVADCLIVSEPVLAPFPAIVSTNSDLRVLAGTAIATTQASPLCGGTGSLRIDPSVSLANGGGPLFAGIQVVTQVMPVVRAETDAASGLARASLLGPASASGILFVGRPAPEEFISPGLDPLVVDSSTAVAVAVAAPGSLLMPLATSYVVPPQPVLLGVRVTWQGASLDAANGLQISNGVTYVHY